MKTLAKPSIFPDFTCEETNKDQSGLRCPVIGVIRHRNLARGNKLHRAPTTFLKVYMNKLFCVLKY